MTGKPPTDRRDPMNPRLLNTALLGLALAVILLGIAILLGPS